MVCFNLTGIFCSISSIVEHFVHEQMRLTQSINMYFHIQNDRQSCNGHPCHMLFANTTTCEYCICYEYTNFTKHNSRYYLKNRNSFDFTTCIYFVHAYTIKFYLYTFMFSLILNIMINFHLCLILSKYCMENVHESIEIMTEAPGSCSIEARRVTHKYFGTS